MSGQEPQRSADSDDLFWTFFRDSPDVILIIDGESGSILHANDSLQRVLGYSPGALAGNHFSSLYPAGADEARNHLLDQLRVYGPVFEAQQVLHADGRTIPMDLTAVPVFFRGRSGFLATYRDVTDRQNAQRALRESEAKYRGLVESSPVGIVSCDESGRVTELNAAALDILQLDGTKGRLCGNLVDSGSLNDLGIAAQMVRCLESGEPEVDEIAFTSRKRRERHIRVRIAPLKGPDGALSGAQAVIEDISDHKQAERLVLRSEKLKAVVEMAAGVANNLNATLDTVAGGMHSAITALEARDYPALRPSLDRIRNSAYQASRTIRRLQQFAEVRSMRASSPAQVVDLSEAARMGADRAEFWWQSTEKPAPVVSIDKQLNDGCLVHGDLEEMAEVVENLVQNALEAHSQAGNVKLSTWKEGTDVVLEVKDKGAGISKKEMARLGEPFWTSKFAHAGMGLAISFGIVRRHRGTVAVTSKPGKGATFSIRFPSTPQPLENPTLVTSGDTGSGRRLLLISDPDRRQGSLPEKLASHRVTVISTPSVDQVLDLLAQGQGEVILWSLDRPVREAFDTAHKIRDFCMAKDIPRPPFIVVPVRSGAAAGDEVVMHPDVDRIVEGNASVDHVLQVIEEEVCSSVTRAAFSGRIDKIDILEYLQMILLTGQRMVVEIRSRESSRGLLFIESGRIRHAVCGDLQGEAALFKCLSSRSGSFSNLAWHDPGKTTIEKPGEFVLMEAARIRDEAVAAQRAPEE